MAAADPVPYGPIYAGAGAPSRPEGDSSLVQFGRRVAFSGMSVKHVGHVLVAGECEAGERLKRSIITFTGLTTRKNTAAPMMTTVSTRLMKSP